MDAFSVVSVENFRAVFFYQVTVYCSSVVLLCNIYRAFREVVPIINHSERFFFENAEINLNKILVLPVNCTEVHI